MGLARRDGRRGGRSVRRPTATGSCVGRRGPCRRCSPRHAGTAPTCGRSPTRSSDGRCLDGPEQCSNYVLHARALDAIGRGDFENAYRDACAISPAGTIASHVPHAMWMVLDLVEAAMRTGRTRRGRRPCRRRAGHRPARDLVTARADHVWRSGDGGDRRPGRRRSVRAGARRAGCGAVAVRSGSNTARLRRTAPPRAGDDSRPSAPHRRTRHLPAARRPTVDAASRQRAACYRSHDRSRRTSPGQRR